MFVVVNERAEHTSARTWMETQNGRTAHEEATDLLLSVTLATHPAVVLKRVAVKLG